MATASRQRATREVDYPTGDGKPMASRQRAEAADAARRQLEEENDRLRRELEALRRR